MCTIVLVNTNNRAAIDEIETQETQRTDYYETVEFHAIHILRQEKKIVKFWIFSTQFVDFQMTINFVRTDDAKKSQLSSFLFVLHGLFDESIFINGAFWCIFKWSIWIFFNHAKFVFLFEISEWISVEMKKNNFVSIS